MKKITAKIIGYYFLALLIFILCPNQASASQCETVHPNFTSKCVESSQACPSDMQGIDDTNHCDEGYKCCIKKAADSATDLQPTSAENIQLQIPLFDFGDASNIAQYIAKIYEYILIVFVPFTIIMIIWGGIQWVMSSGEPNRIKGAKNQIIQAFTGLFIGLASYLILSLVGITELKLPTLEKVKRIEGQSLSMQENFSGAGGAGGTDGTTPGTTIDPNSCTGTWRGMAVKCLDPDLGGARWDGGEKQQMVDTGPVLVSKTIGAPPYFVQYVETSKTAGKKIIALTIDLCTPGSGYESSIPEYLVNNFGGVKATFFLGSDWAGHHSDGFNYIKSHNNLFEIGNHSKTHPAEQFTSPFWDGPAGTQAAMDSEWKDSQAWFTSHGVTPTICRLPVAAPNRMERSGSIKFLKSASPCAEFIQYSMWPGDGPGDLGFIKSHLKKDRGEILLIHGGKSVTARNLPNIVSFLKSQNYEFVTVSELLSKYGG